MLPLDGGISPPPPPKARSAACVVFPSYNKQSAKAPRSDMQSLFLFVNFISSCYQKREKVGSIKLKPQDSLGEFNNFFLDLQKVQEIIRKHHQTFLQLFGMTL